MSCDRRTRATHAGRAERAGRAARAAHCRDAGDHRPLGRPDGGAALDEPCPRPDPDPPPNPVRAARALALLHVALFDTLVATGMPARPTRDRRQRWTRPSSPWGRHPASRRRSLGAGRRGGRRATVLAYLFPKESAGDVARAGGRGGDVSSWPDAAFRSDVEAGQAIGRAVGERAVAGARRTARTPPGMARAG